MASPAPLYAVPTIDIAPFRDGSDKRGVPAKSHRHAAISDSW